MHWRRLASRRRRVAARLVGVALLLAGIFVWSPVQAQEAAPSRAGLVIDFGEGNVSTACVDLGNDGQATGEEVLRASGLDVVMEFTAVGGAVCRIGNQGCAYPSEPCWCQCMSSPCIYWAYYHLVGGQWVYSSTGASTHIVHSGDVEGWAWGAGTVAIGALPALRTFDQICAPATATPTWTPPPTATPTTAPAIWPTDTPPSPPTATWTPPATATPQPSLTATAAPTATPSATALPPQPAEGTPAPPAPLDVESGWSPRVFLPAVQRNAGQPSLLGVAAGSVAVAPVGAVSPAPTATPTTPPQSPALAWNDRRAPAGLPRLAMTPAIDPATNGRVATAKSDPVLPAVIALLLTVTLAAARTARRVALTPPAVQPVPWLHRALGPLALSATAWAGRRPQRSRSVLAAGRAGRPTGGVSARLLSPAIYALTAGIGVLALLQPFLAARAQVGGTGSAGVSGPLLMTVLIALCFLALLVEVQGQVVSAKMIALLGVLVAINSVLRFVEVSIPGPGGFTPIFFLIVMTGYVFGGRFGFLLGALTLLVSALITGGVGPWLPGQMFTAGWMGLAAPLARPLVQLTGSRPGSRGELVVLTIFAGMAGLFYGVVINLWFWPFMTGPADQYWQAGAGLASTVQRYAAYYVATSLLWDGFAVLGNVMLVAAFGRATVRALRRFQQRFAFEYREESATAIAPEAAAVQPAAAKSPLPPPAVSMPSR